MKLKIGACLLIFMTLPVISVLIPTYNRLGLLKRALESVLQQTYENLEVVVSDNCSTDGTHEYCRNIISGTSRNLIYIKQDLNIGPIENLKRALQASSGVYISFVADDDYVECRYIDILYKYLISGGGVHAASLAREVTPSGVCLRVEDYAFLGQKTDIDLLLCAYHMGRSSNLALVHYGLTERRVLSQIFPEPVFDPPGRRATASGLEVPYIARLLSQGKVVIVPHVLYNYTGPGEREGTQSLASELSSQLSTADAFIIFLKQFWRLLWFALSVDKSRVSTYRLVFVVVSSFVSEFAIRVLRKGVGFGSSLVGRP